MGWQDLPELAALKSDPLVYAQMLGGVRSRAETAADLVDDLRCWGRHGVGIWSVRAHAGTALLGITGIHERPDGRGMGLRFAFRRDARGHGYAREAAAAALRFAHEQAGLPRIVAVARETNIESRTVLGAIGMRVAEAFDRGGERMLMFESLHRR